MLKRFELNTYHHILALSHAVAFSTLTQIDAEAVDEFDQYSYWAVVFVAGL
jgi:hypothetical protein